MLEFCQPYCKDGTKAYNWLGVLRGLALGPHLQALQENPIEAERAGEFIALQSQIQRGICKSLGALIGAGLNLSKIY